jgi:hypothetical protein
MQPDHLPRCVLDAAPTERWPDPDKLPQFGANTPLGRPRQPAELAAICVLLASNESSYATGQVYGAVGGRGGRRGKAPGVTFLPPRRS